MGNRTEKAKKSSNQLVLMLRDEKGITFEGMNETLAETYFLTKSNYLRAASYRFNYDKHQSGDKVGKYINLDFSCLTKLSTIDMVLRSILLKMCIDVEHAIKVSLLTEIEQNAVEDGYTIVDSFLAYDQSILDSIIHKADSIFTGELIQKYFRLCYVTSNGAMEIKPLKIDCPAWVLVELLSFHDLLSFYKHYYNKYNKTFSFKFNTMNPVRSLRNACAHNNCLLVSLHPKNTHPPAEISQFVASISTIGKEERQKKLSSRPLFEIVSLLYIFNKIADPHMKKRRYGELRAFSHDYLRANNKHFQNNQLISTSFSFLKK